MNQGAWHNHLPQEHDGYAPDGYEPYTAQGTLCHRRGGGDSESPLLRQAP